MEIRAVIPEEGLVTNQVRREGELDVRGVETLADTATDEGERTVLKNFLPQILQFIE